MFVVLYQIHYIHAWIHPINLRKKVERCDRMDEHMNNENRNMIGTRKNGIVNFSCARVSRKKIDPGGTVEI